jgi:hypothetical protein
MWCSKSRHFVCSPLSVVAANRSSGYSHGFIDRCMAMLPILEQNAAECNNPDSCKGTKEVIVEVVRRCFLSNVVFGVNLNIFITSWS